MMIPHARLVRYKSRSLQKDQAMLATQGKILVDRLHAATDALRVATEAARDGAVAGRR